MSTAETLSEEISGESATTRRLSYKFQRLRERVRQAIESGELAGKLPGERTLARRFKVNAKTLSKALTDLAAEGLLQRSIGLGTFVRGTIATRETVRCLFLHDSEQAGCGIIEGLRAQEDLDVQTYDDIHNLPLSLLAQYKWIVVCSNVITDEALRDLVIRGKSVVMLNRPGSYYSTHGVNFDYPNATTELVRRLHRNGHQNLMLVGATDLTELRQDVERALPEGLVLRLGTAGDVAAAMRLGTTGLICHSPELAADVMSECLAAGVSVPENVSVVAMGVDRGNIPCSGQYVSMEYAVSTIKHVLRDAAQHRPVGIWLAGAFQDHKTIAASA
ncbi:MAG: GntR family transcriptional regulator [Burkholderiales bacterium]|nr:GntR family transcriptional regulator [Phycisphaerae bacterium]